MREQFENEEERNNAAKTYIQEACSPIIKVAEEKSQAELAKAKKFASMFKFICPSYWIPGEQSWGAF